MLLLSDRIIALWTNGAIHASKSLNLAVVAYTAVVAWNNIHAYYLNGVSELKLQIRTSIAAICVLPVMIYIMRSNWDIGAATIVVSITIALSIFAALAPREVFRHIALCK
jgi:hypothetical protein